MYAKKIKCIYGYDVCEKRMVYDKNLEYKPYAQAGVKFDEEGVMLVSYESPIIRIACNTIEFYNIAPNCSRATISHVSAFLDEYAPTISYQQIKRAYYVGSENVWLIDGNNLVNTETGEVI